MGRKGSSQRAEGKAGHKVEGETQNIIQMHGSAAVRPTHGSAAVRKLIKKLKRLTAAILISIKNFRRGQEELEKRRETKQYNQTNKQTSKKAHILTLCRSPAGTLLSLNTHLNIHTRKLSKFGEESLKRGRWNCLQDRECPVCSPTKAKRLYKACSV